LAAGALVAVGLGVALVALLRSGSGSARASAVSADSVGVFQARQAARTGVDRDAPELGRLR
jgi:hypothetical protein